MTSPAAVGLCATCQHVRVIENRRGSRFFLCRLSETDPRFARYPRLPVLRCSGYAPAPEAEAVRHRPARPRAGDATGASDGE